MIRKEAVFTGVVLGGMISLGIYQGYRVLRFSPDVKVDFDRKNAPIQDNKEEAMQYKSAMYRRFSTMHSKYVIQPKYVATEDTKRLARVNSRKKREHIGTEKEEE